MELLGSPQGSHDAPAHLLSIPYRAEHVAAAAASSPLLLSTPLSSSCFFVDEQTTGGAVLLPPPCPHTHTHPLQLLQDTNEELMEVNRCCLQREEGLRSCVRTAALPQKERGREWEGERGDRDGERKGRRERGDGRVRL